MPENKSQHYIPQVLQSNFKCLDYSKSVWLFSRDDDPQLKPTSKVFENDYTFDFNAFSGLKMDTVVSVEEQEFVEFYKAIQKGIITENSSLFYSKLLYHFWKRNINIRTAFSNGALALKAKLRHDLDSCAEQIALTTFEKRHLLIEGMLKRWQRHDFLETLTLQNWIKLCSSVDNIAVINPMQAVGVFKSSILKAWDIFLEDDLFLTLIEEGIKLGHLTIIKELGLLADSAVVQHLANTHSFELFYDYHNLILPDSGLCVLNSELTPLEFASNTDLRNGAILLVPLSPCVLLVSQPKGLNILNNGHLNEKSINKWLAQVATTSYIGAQRSLGEYSSFIGTALKKPIFNDPDLNVAEGADPLYIFKDFKKIKLGLLKNGGASDSSEIDNWIKSLWVSQNSGGLPESSDFFVKSITVSEDISIKNKSRKRQPSVKLMALRTNQKLMIEFEVSSKIAHKIIEFSLMQFETGQESYRTKNSSNIDSYTKPFVTRSLKCGNSLCDCCDRTDGRIIKSVFIGPLNRGVHLMLMELTLTTDEKYYIQKIFVVK